MTADASALSREKIIDQIFEPPPIIARLPKGRRAKYTLAFEMLSASMRAECEHLPLPTSALMTIERSVTEYIRIRIQDELPATRKTRTGNTIRAGGFDDPDQRKAALQLWNVMNSEVSKLLDKFRASESDAARIAELRGARTVVDAMVTEGVEPDIIRAVRDRAIAMLDAGV